MQKLESGSDETAADVRRITKQQELPSNSKDLTRAILHTCYMGTKNSSLETRQRAALLAEQVGSHHQEVKIDPMVDAILKVYLETGDAKKEPTFEVDGGTKQPRRSGGCRGNALAVPEGGLFPLDWPSAEAPPGWIGGPQLGRGAPGRPVSHWTGCCRSTARLEW